MVRSLLRLLLQTLVCFLKIISNRLFSIIKLGHGDPRLWQALLRFHDAGPLMLRRLLYVLVYVSSCRGELMLSFVHAAGDVAVTL